jgi:DNA-binding FadR family transcriptional regulator
MQGVMTMRGKALQPLLDYLENAPRQRGGRLPPERELATTIGVSRQALRRALDCLEKEGKLARQVGRGTFYLDPCDPARPVAASSTGSIGIDFDLGVPTNPVEVMEVRLVIEPQSARWAALRASQADLDFMNTCLNNMKEAIDWETYDSWDGALHRAICKATRNELLLMLFDRFNEARRQVSWGELRQQALKGDWKERYQEQHTILVATIASRNFVQAEIRMREHIETIRADLFGEGQV